jgi:hypothetical protein
MRLNELRSQLRSLLSGDWSGTLLNPNYVQRNRSITWYGYESTIVPEDVSFKDVAALSERRQYSFQLSVDGSIFQFYYAYDEDERTVTAARVAYYEAKGAGFSTESLEFSRPETEQQPLPARESNQIAEPEPETAALAEQQPRLQPQAIQVGEPGANEVEAIPREGALPVIDSGESGSQTSLRDERRPRWFRIDFRAAGAQCVLHNDCHIHFAGFPGSRLVVAGVPTPKQFVEFVFCCCYPKLYEKVRLNGAGQYVDQAKIQNVNETRVPPNPNPIFSQMTHLRIPGA